MKYTPLALAFAFAFAFLALLPLAGCDQTVDEGTPDSGITPDKGATADQTLTEAGADAATPDAIAGKTVEVVYGGKSVTVPLLKPTSVTFEGTAHARLDHVVALGLPGKDQAKLKADFESSDGYRPSTKSTCDQLVLKAGTVFKQGYLDVQTRKLRWEQSLKYPGCLFVKDVAKVLVTDL